MAIQMNSVPAVSTTSKAYTKQDTAPESQEVQAAPAAKAPVQDVYEPSQDTVETEDITYTPESRSLADQLKLEQAEIQARFLRTVQDMITSQGREIAIGEGIWKFLASGEYTVDAETQAAAKQAISEDGYWGVAQTSQRIVSFAKALVGGDPSRVEEMREAFVKGFKAATDTWGGKLPDITSQAYDAVMALFDEWAASE